jgi:hypothetical protein
LLDGDDFGFGEQFIQLLHQSLGDLLATADDLDDVHHFAPARQSLHRVQVCEDTRVVHGPCGGEDRQDGESFAEQIDLVTFMQGQAGGNVRPDQSFGVAQRFDHPLADKGSGINRRLLAGYVGVSTAADGPGEDAGPLPCCLCLEL